MKPGAAGVIVLFALTIITAVSFKNFLGLQPALGMMLGLGYLQVWSYILQQRGKRADNTDMVLNSFKQIERVEWDTLLFFFGIIFAVGGLGVMGYLASANAVSLWRLGADHRQHRRRASCPPLSTTSRSCSPFSRWTRKCRTVNGCW
jgi:hypothetical protein